MSAAVAVDLRRRREQILARYPALRMMQTHPELAAEERFSEWGAEDAWEELELIALQLGER